MAFNHDNFVVSANYLALDASLQWYLDAVGPKRSAIEKLAIEHPGKMKAMLSNDPVLLKLRKIAREMRDLMEFVE